MVSEVGWKQIISCLMKDDVQIDSFPWYNRQTYLDSLPRIQFLS